MEKIEFIVCAANHYNDGIERTFNPKNIDTGLVICGHRHHNCIQMFAELRGFPYSEESLEIMRTEIQGFLTSKNRFVDRKEALVIALENDQVLDITTVCGNKLFSEDLY